jgi:NADPH:quinone reductase-like Zn-dependent oxidoreductase
MNQTTRVIRFHKTGGPEVLRIEEVRRPKPTGNEVLVRVQALGLSRPDLVWREGSSFEEPVFPAQIGYDAAGGPGLEELIWATKRFGHVIVYGQLEAMDDETSLPLGACFLRGLKVHASFRVYDFTGNPKLGLPARTEAIERAKKFVSDGLASGLFTPQKQQKEASKHPAPDAQECLGRLRVGKVQISEGVCPFPLHFYLVFFTVSLVVSLLIIQLR